MAHYFDGGVRPKMQGSLSADEFERGLEAYGTRLVRAGAWLLHTARTDVDAVAVTLDDGLREQVKIALPILERWGLTAFWNIYTQPYVGVPHSLETYRLLRNCAFGSIDEFYDQWWAYLSRHGHDWPIPPKGYLDAYGYLTAMDRTFRYWRNEMVTPAEYARAMDELARRAEFTPDVMSDHWIRPDELRALHKAGHVIGFHTHTHPMTLAGLTAEQIATEYATSRAILAAILNIPVEEITTMSHPGGSITPDGETWLKTHGIVLAWGATMHGSMPWNAPRWSTGYWR